MENQELEKPAAAEETTIQPEKEKKALTPQEMEKRRKLIVIPIFVLIFLGVMY